MQQLKNLLESFHSYFVKSPKKILKLQKFTTFHNTKGNKKLWNVKTH
jgi:hypothetical protein